MDLDALTRRIAAEKDDTRRARLELEAALLSNDPAFLEAATRDNPELVAAVHEARVREPDPRKRVEWIDRELRISPNRADLLIERARVLGTVEAWEAARAVAPDHDEIFAALEVALIRVADEKSLATHYARLARNSKGDPLLACSYFMARGRIFERLGDDEAAESAYAEAVILHDRARTSYARVLQRRGSFTKLRDHLIEDVDKASEPATKIALLYRAARLSDERLADPRGAIDLLKRAVSVGGDARVAEELVRLLETHGDAHEAAAARRLRIGYEELPAMRALEERRLAVELEAANDPAGAIEALERARAIEPLDEVSVAMLDRLLAVLGRDEDRLGLWVSEATRAPEGTRGARAYVRAAAIADTLGRSDDALRMLRAAWATRPGDEDALDGQLRLLIAPRADATSIVSAVELLIHAADLAEDIALRVAGSRSGAPCSTSSVRRAQPPR